jgi:WD40 repeat protein
MIGSAQAQTAVPEYRELVRFERDTVTILSNLTEHFAFSPDSEYIAAASSSGSVDIWRIDTGEVAHSLGIASTSVSWSPDGSLIAIGNDYDYNLTVWDTTAETIRYQIAEYSGRHITWSPDSAQFATDAMQVFDAQTGEVVLQLGANWSVPYHAYWSPDGARILTTTEWEGDYAHLWSLDGERLDTYWAGKSASWSPDSTRIATFGQVREISTGLPVVIIPNMQWEIAWHPDGEWIASVDDEGAIFLWDADSGEMITEWTAEGCHIKGFAWSPNGERFAIDCIIADPEYSNDLIIWERVR